MRRHASAAALAATLLALPACSDDDGGTTTSSVPESAPYNQADVDFATEMMTHHVGALLMVDVAAPRDDLSPRLTQLIESIRTAQTGEIETMTDWLEDWEQPVPDTARDHGGADHGDTMTGMEDLSDLEATSGAEFEQLWLTLMVEHHEGAIEMAETEVAEGEDADAVALAEQIVATQAAEIERMEKLLD